MGKVHPSHRCCYVPYAGKEHKHEDYEVLVNPGTCIFNIIGIYLYMCVQGLTYLRSTQGIAISKICCLIVSYIPVDCNL